MRNTIKAAKIAECLQCITNQFHPRNLPIELFQKELIRFVETTSKNYRKLETKLHGKTLEEKVGSLKGKKKERFEDLAKKKEEEK